MNSLARASAIQTSVSIVNRVLGVVTLTLVYRAFDLGTIGEYFYLAGIFTFFLTLAQFGSTKVLVKEYIEGKVYQASNILFTRFYASSTLVIGYTAIAIYSTEVLSEIEILLLACCLVASTLTFDFVLMGNRRFLHLGVYQILGQLLVIAFLSVSIWTNAKISITAHQVVPTFFMFVIIYFAAQGLDPQTRHMGNFLRHGSPVNFSYFANNVILLTTAVLLGAISSIDYAVGKFFLNSAEMGVYAGLLRLAAVTYSFMLVLNTIFFAYSISSKESTRRSRKIVTTVACITTFITYSVMSFPYMTIVMDIEDPSYLLPTASLMLVGATLMPLFFLYLSTLETTSSTEQVKRVWRELLLAALIYVSIILLFSIFPIKDYQFETVACIFLLKWILLTVALFRIERMVLVK
jgi:O-antigen/teichoic acid export membrane protein